MKKSFNIKINVDIEKLTNTFGIFDSLEELIKSAIQRNGINITSFKELSNWLGVDVNLEISVFEYGILYNKDTTELIYGIGKDYNANYITFKSIFWTDDDSNTIIDENWFNKKGFLDCVGLDEENWKKSYIVNKIYDLINYYGYLNILGENIGRKIYTKEEIELLINQL